MNRFKKPVPETPDDDGCRCRQASAESVLAMPAGIDPDWRERIALAKRAYQDGKKLREGKPTMFRTTWPLSLGRLGDE